MNKEQPPKNNDEADQETKAQKAAASWEAWQDWKITCSVAGSNPDNQIILQDEIQWAFWHKITEIFPDKCKQIMASTKDWAYEFDSGIHNPDVKKYVRGFAEYADTHQEEAEEHGKFFKDYLWLLCEKREYGTKLDFIKGKLIGSGGIINQVVEHYIRREHNELYINWMRNRDNKTKDSPKTYIAVQSLDQPLKEDKTITLMDVISSDSDYPQASEEMTHKSEIDLESRLNAFTWQEIACLLASVPGKLTHPATMKFVGINSMAAMSRFNNDKEFNRKRITFQKYMEKADTSLEEKKECINLMKKRLKAEKNSEEFLNMIEPDFESIFNRIEAYYDKKFKEKEEN